jgi:transposase
MVAATLTPGSSVSLVVRRYDVNPNQVFAWRRRWVSRTGRELRLMPVTVTPDRPIETAPAHAGELIEIKLAGSYRVRVGSGVKAPALRLVLDVLEQR